MWKKNGLFNVASVFMWNHRMTISLGISPARLPTPEAEGVRVHGFCLRLIHLSDLKAGWEHSDPLA